MMPTCMLIFATYRTRSSAESMALLHMATNVKYMRDAVILFRRMYLLRKVGASVWVMIDSFKAALQILRNTCSYYAERT